MTETLTTIRRNITPEPDMNGIETIEYRDNAIWRNGKVERVLFPAGYATLAGGREDGEPTFHYYTTDYLGNVRAVINGTTGETEQTVAYYPFGGVISTLGTNRSLQHYKFGGKELLTANGLNEYDFGARSYVPMVPAFTSVDPLSEKYYWLSPYLYCENNPVNAFDPDGKDIFILKYGDDVLHQHLAMLIQNEAGKWQYYSINGNNVYSSGIHTGGREFNDIGVGEWDSPQDFLDSKYNDRNENSKENPAYNNYGFEEGYQIKSTPEQDTKMSNEFKALADTEYDLINNNCATAVQKVMVDAGIPVSKPSYENSSIAVPSSFGLIEIPGPQKMNCNISTLPHNAYNSIIKWNNGSFYHKRH